jgi:hypothetical protein
MKFYQNSPSVSRVVPCGRTDTTKLIVAFRDYANAPKHTTVEVQGKMLGNMWEVLAIHITCRGVRFPVLSIRENLLACYVQYTIKSSRQLGLLI